MDVELTQFLCSKLNHVDLRVTWSVEVEVIKAREIDRQADDRLAAEVSVRGLDINLHCASISSQIYEVYGRRALAQQTRAIEPLLVQCWASVVDGGPTLNQQWLNISCFLSSCAAGRLFHADDNSGIGVSAQQRVSPKADGERDGISCLLGGPRAGRPTYLHDLRDNVVLLIIQK